MVLLHRFVRAGFAAGFLKQPDGSDHHIFVGRLEHVVDGETGDRYRRQRLHLDAGLAANFDFGAHGNARRRVSIVCGNGGIHLPQEYLRGADGAMTGFAFPDMMVRLDALMRAGKQTQAEDLYDLYLPVLRHEFQPGIGLALRKEILRRRGAIASKAARAPAPKLDADDLAELDSLLARLEKKTGQPITALSPYG